MHECKGEEVLNANLIGASSGRGKGSMKVSLYGTFQMFTLPEIRDKMAVARAH